MKWPLVSRHALEVAEKFAAFCESSLQSERARNDALQERLLSLKMTGAVEPPRPVEREWDGLVGPAPKVDELRDLIDAKSGGNLRVRGMMLKQLQQDRSAGLKDEEIEARILAGVQSDGVPS